MKQIFEWLREQINENAFPTHENYSAVWHDDVMHIINEAEAKWEAEVCEWKLTTYSMHDGKHYGYKTTCNYGYTGTKSKSALSVLSHYNFCPYCRNPIKISEVE